jgi:hypothetical protein
MDQLAQLAQEMAMEKRYGTKYTYSFDELDAISQAAACRFAQIERDDFYEKNWPEFFKAWRFHADGTRAF